MALIGNTVYLGVTFKAKNGMLSDPSSVELKIYQEGSHTPLETIPIDSSHRVSVGVYEYPYVVPSGEGNLEYEFAGIIDGLPSKNRETLPRTWKRR